VPSPPGHPSPIFGPHQYSHPLRKTFARFIIAINTVRAHCWAQ
jgi:hypothetical protein